MEIKKYHPQTSPQPGLLELLNSKYGIHKNYEYFRLDFQKAYFYCVDNPNITFLPFSVIEDDQLVAHIALIIDNRLPKGEAFFGFIESKKDFSLFKKVWAHLKKEAKIMGVKRLLGPVNGSIWHQYRCIKTTDNSVFFKSEPISETYYYEYLTKMKPVTEISYYSASRTKFDKVMGVIETGFKKFTAAGFEIKEVANVTYDQLLAIAKTSRNVFSKSSWGYTDLTEKEFLQLYSSEKLDAHLNKLYLLLKDQQIIGFCGTSSEDKQTIILKTICILPEYQGLGLGNALAYKVHLDAQNEGYKKVIYALIREGNQVKNFPQDDTNIFRSYSTFEFEI